MVGLAGRQLDNIAQIHGSQCGLNLGRVVIGILLEYKHLGMVVKRERLLGILVVNHQRADGRIIFKGGHQIKPEVALEHTRFSHPVTPDDILVGRAAEQLAVIGARQRVALRDAGGLHILMGGGNKDVIGLAEVAFVAR